MCECESDSGTAGIVSRSPAWNDTSGRGRGPADSAEEGDGPLTFEPRPARWRKRITVRITVLCSAQDALQRQHYAHKFAFHLAFTFAPRLMAFNCSCAVCLVMKEPALSPPAGPTTLPSSRSEHMFASSLYFRDTVLGERAVTVLVTTRFPNQRIEKN